MQLGILLLTLVCLPGPPADASSESEVSAAGRERARQLVDQGNAHFKKGALSEALDRFRAAYSAFPSPKILLNMAETHRAMREPVLAARLYDQFLAGSGEKDGAVVQRVTERLRELEPSIARIEVLCNVPDADVLIDDMLVGRTPVRAWIVGPGTRAVAVRKDGYRPHTSEHVVDPRQRLTVSAVLTSIPPPPLLVATPPAPPPRIDVAVAPPPPEPTSDSVVSKWWFWTGAAVILVAAASVGAVVASSGSEFRLEGELGSSSTADPEWNPK